MQNALGVGDFLPRMAYAYDVVGKEATPGRKMLFGLEFSFITLSTYIFFCQSRANGDKKRQENAFKTFAGDMVRYLPSRF
jgi:hypothetical protein